MSRLLAGRYELVDKIGEGGMAVVYRAKDRLLNRFVAIKVLRPEYSRDDQFIESFRRESQAAAGLSHPNIVSIFDVGKTGNINYIVMELVDGRPLSDIIEEKAPLEYSVVIDIARQMASALSMAHKNQIIHRDVKPHNILISSDGMAKLTDFGIAKAVSSAAAMTDTSKIIGSVHYFSPEQARGSYVDERSDIYSLGIVMYEMLTGRVPFDGENPVEVALKHINEEIIPPSKIVGGIPPNLEKLVMKATDKFQTNRYKSADELLEDLENIKFVSQYVNSGIGLAQYVTSNRGQSQGFTPIDAEEKARIEAGRSIQIRNTGVGKSSSENRKPSSKGKGKGGASGGGNDEDKKNKRTIAIVLAIVIALGIAGLLMILAISGVIGGGSGEVKVPDLMNRTYEQATKDLEALGLQIKRGDDISSEEVEEGLVAQQMPVAGSNVKEGKVVTVRISSGRGAVEVPDLRNKTFNEAKEILEELGFNITTGEGIFSETVEEGKIVSQSPEAKSKAKPGEIITVIMSKGAEQIDVEVPYLIGSYYYDRNSMEAYLSDFGLHLGEVTESESMSDAGSIIDQSPAGGSIVDKGSFVNIVIAVTPTKVTVPSLTGMTIDEAAYTCEDRGLYLEMGDLVDDPTGTGIPGTIIRQNIEPNIEVEPGSTIVVYVIKDYEEPIIDDSGGMDGGDGTDDMTDPNAIDENSGEEG